MTDLINLRVHRQTLPLAATLMLIASCAFGKPPSAQSPATGAAIDAYHVCLSQVAAKAPSVAGPRPEIAACAGLEAAVSDALLKENPDRPLFARSYVESMREQALAQWAAPTPVPVTLALRVRP